jgi:hypothetical protein
MNPETTRRYNLCNDNFEMEIEVDHALMTDEKLHEINNFWSGERYRISSAGSVLNAVLQLVFNQSADFVFRCLANEPKDLICEFNHKEGFPPMDGSYGILIVQCDREVVWDTPFISEVEK